MQKIFSYYKNLNSTQKVSSLFILISVEVLYIVHLIRLLSLTNAEYSTILFQIILSTIISQSLLLLSIYDIKKFEIPLSFTNALIAFFLIINIFWIFTNSFEINILLMGTNPLNNFIGAGVGAIFILLIVLITRGNGMGLGDVRIMFLLGLIFGLDRLVIGFYMTLIISLVFAFIVFVFKRSIRGVMIPLVPFLVLGILFAFILNLQFSTIFLANLL